MSGITQECKLTERKINTDVCPLDCDTVAYSSRRYVGRSAAIFRVSLSKEASVFSSVSDRVSDVRQLALYEPQQEQRTQRSTAIPRLNEIIRSGITFVSRNLR